jgi:Secretion system C-terminal sorting domain
MKKELLSAILIFLAGTIAAQQLVIGSHDVVRQSEYPSDAFLIEADARSFFRISGFNSTNSDHPLLGTAADPDFQSLYFIKYDNEGKPLKSNFVRGTYDPVYAGSFGGGFTLMANASEQVEANGQIIDVPLNSNVEFIANYDRECQLEKIINIWAPVSNQYVDSKAIMDPEDGSVYLYGEASMEMELESGGSLGKGLSYDYFYLIKFDHNLDRQWVYQFGFDMDKSGTSPYFHKVQVHPGKEGGVLITGTYGSESSPLIAGKSLPAYMDGYGTFAVLLNGAAQTQWVLDGNLQDFGYASRIFKAFSLPDGSFVLSGNTNTGYYSLGDTQFTFSDKEANNQFVFRLDYAGNLLWGTQFESQGKVEEGKKKSTESEVLDDKIFYDALAWNNRLLYLCAPYSNPTFSVAGNTLDLTYQEGIYVAALDIRDGTELWAYAVSSDKAEIYGFDVDRAGNVSFMGSNYYTQDLDGITDVAVVAGDFLFFVGLDYNGKVLWYDNASLQTPPYNDLRASDLEVLPNGEVFSTMKLYAVNDIVVGESVVGEGEFQYSSWLVGLASEVVLGGVVSDADENPVYPGYVKAVKSTFWGCYPVVDSVMLQDDGRYLLENLYPGNYAIVAVADQVQYPHALPTYFGDQTGWESASFHNIYPKFNSDINNIRLAEVEPLSSSDGSGQMSGAIYYADEERSMKKGISARPAPKSAVILLKKSKKSTMAGEVVAYTETDDFGMFAFQNVPDGDYLLHVEVPGLEMLETHEVTIIGNQIVSGLDYTISDNGIFIGWGVGISMLENKTLDIYPNPGPGLILMDLPAAGDYAVAVYSTDGRLVLNREIQSLGGATSLNISGEPDGIYFITVEGPELSTTIKYVKR